MRAILLSVAMLAATISGVSAEQMWGADEVISVWDNSTAPHSNNLSGDEIPAGTEGDQRYNIGNISEAKLYIYEAKGKKRSDKAVVICPGGGYRIVSMLNEGQKIAEWFAENGITAAVVKYRLPNGVKEVPFEDVVEASKILKSKAGELGFDPQKVGIYGASAGGHLAANISTLTTGDDIPYFSVLFYPVISSEIGIIHAGSFNNLLGVDRSESVSEEYSLDKRVSEDTPPTIIFHCSDDKTVSPINSTLYYNALYQFNEKSSLHIFPTGRHGWGNKDNFKYQDVWQSLTLSWLEGLD